MNFEKLARKIMRKTKGWKVRDESEDRRDFPKEHCSELKWITIELQKVYATGLMDPRKMGKKKE